MPCDKYFSSPDADVTLRALGPPECDFRVHKVILSLASPVFKNMFSIPRQTTPTPEDSADVIPVINSPRALRTILRMIYPVAPPILINDLDNLVECLALAEKYEMEVVTSQLRHALSQIDAPLQVYAIASRFKFTGIAETTLPEIILSTKFIDLPRLPDDFNFISAAIYHNLVRERAHYLEAAAEVIKQTPLKVACSDCRRGPFTTEAFRLRLTHIIMTGIPPEVTPCLEAWAEAYGRNDECDEDCVAKFIRAAILRIGKWLANPGEFPPTMKAIPKKM